MTINLREILPWSPPVQQGTRLLREAPAVPEFWTLWRQHRKALVAAGVSCAKDREGLWMVRWRQYPKLESILTLPDPHERKPISNLHVVTVDGPGLKEMGDRVKRDEIFIFGTTPKGDRYVVTYKDRTKKP